MTLSHSEKDNLTRWKEGKRGFHEVYYLKWNDPKEEVATWIRYTLLAPLNRNPELSVWAIFFDSRNPNNNRAIKKTYSVRESRIERDFFYFSAGPSAIFQRGARGELKDEKSRFSWEIKFKEENSISLKHFPLPLYWGEFPKTKFLAPHLATTLSGEFQIDDRQFKLSQVPAHQAHLWGTEQANSWVWGNCNSFSEDPNFCFEGLSAQVKVGKRLTPPMTLLFFYWEGKMYRFNSPRQWFSNQSQNSLDRWHFEAGSRNLRFVGDFFARTENMVGVRYEDPQGGERFCHNTKIADLKIQILRRQGSNWNSIKTVTASKTAAFEMVQPTPDKRVKFFK